MVSFKTVKNNLLAANELAQLSLTSTELRMRLFAYTNSASSSKRFLKEVVAQGEDERDRENDVFHGWGL